jgi:uncharacterized membrane protein (UPF0136 family)
MLKDFFQKLGDHSGVWGGLLCLLHCLAVPLAGILPVLGGVATHSLHNHFLDFIFMGIAAFAVVLSLRRTHRLWVRAMLLSGLALFISGTLLHEDLPWMLAVASLGSLLLIVAHGSNLLRYRRRSCPVPQH